MNPDQAATRAVLHARMLALIGQLGAKERGGEGNDAGPSSGQNDFLELLGDLAAYQRTWVLPYAQFWTQRPCAWAAPALPTDAFRFARISSLPPASDVRRFLSSGTTHDARSTHAFGDLSLYDAAAHAAARHMLFPDRERMQLLILAPTERELPESSLSYMLARFVEWFGDAHSGYVWPLDERAASTLVAKVHAARERSAPVALLGTSFAFVHAMDRLAGQKLALPPGSRIMQTGGFKGRSRELSPDEMRAALAASFDVDPALIVAEYGMTELSSQLYETTLREVVLGLPRTQRRLWAPPWLRVSVLDPERLEPVPEGQPGLVRLDDAANLDSVTAIQTADVGLAQAGGLILQGRAQGAVARGCSITAEALLQGRAR